MQPENNSLDYVTDQTFRKIDRLFVQLFRSGENDPIMNFFGNYYINLVEIKDFSAYKNRMKNLPKCQTVILTYAFHFDV